MKFLFWNRGFSPLHQGFRVQLQNVAALLRKQASELTDVQERSRLLGELEMVEATYHNDLRQLSRSRQGL